MTDYVIGDIHGCYDELIELLELVSFTPSVDRLISCGDIIDKGPNDVGVIKLLMKVNCILVLGNHDIAYLLSSKTDQHMLSNPYNLLFSNDEFLEWLKDSVLMYNVANGMHVVHAGVPLNSNVTDLYKKAEQAKQFLLELLESNIIYSNSGSWYSIDYKDPNQRSITSCKHYKTLSSFTLWRKVNKEGVGLDLTEMQTELSAQLQSEYKNSVEYKPWFQQKLGLPHDDILFFGHWSRLGYYLLKTDEMRNQLVSQCYCLDTSCVYGGELSMMSIPDRKKFSVKARNNYVATRKNSYYS